MSNRWTIVAGALLIQLCLGAIYSWSIFVNPLEDAYNFTRTQANVIFSVALASFALTMILAGKWQDKAGPRKVATVGGIVLGLGYLLASQVGGSYIGLVVSVGLIGGAGIGFGYVCPIAACVKWFPDKRGMVSALAVAGFGSGAWIFTKLGAKLIVSGGVSQALTPPHKNHETASIKVGVADFPSGTHSTSGRVSRKRPPFGLS